jgi:hypothetical protein
LLTVPAHDCGCRLEPNADAMLVDVCAFGGNAPHDIVNIAAIGRHLDT